MDDLTERDIAPSVGTDAVSELLPLLQSEEWQKRLEAARQQRERILAERGPTPDLPPRPMMPRLELVATAAAEAAALPRIEPLSGLRAGPVPRPDSYPAEEEEFEEFDDISAPPPRPLPGLRVVPPNRPMPQAEARPAPAAPVVHQMAAPADAVRISASAPPAEPVLPKSWLTTRKIAGGFALGIAIGLGFSLSSLVTSRLTRSTAPDALLPASSSPVAAPAVIAPPATVTLQTTAQTGASSADLPQPHAGTVPATPGILTGSAPDSVPQVPVVIARPTPSAQPEASPSLASETPPLIVPPAALANAAETSVAAAPATPPTDEPAPRLAAPVLLSPLLGPGVLGVAVQPDALPLASTGPDAILAATDLTSLAALAPPEISARLPGAGIAPVRLAAPQPGGSLAPDLALGPPEAPPVPPLVEVQLFVPSGMSDAKAQETADLAASAGFAPAAAKPVNVKIKSTQVRYFHEEDQLQAERLAEAVGGTARSFIGADGAPATGVVELWLAGPPATPVAATKPASAKPAKAAKAAKPKKQQTAAAKPAAPAKPSGKDQISAMKSSIAEKFDPKKFK